LSPKEPCTCEVSAAPDLSTSSLAMVRVEDLPYLREAIRLAHESLAHGDPPYGSVLVAADGRVLGKERNTTLSQRDLTAHPELKLARWSHQTLPIDVRRASTLYTSCEPCPMCSNALARSGIGRVCFALSTAQLESLKPPGHISPDAAPPTTAGPALYDDARAPVKKFFM
jgi:tRNA(Arg) A34 adenosine deaminase TadA